MSDPIDGSTGSGANRAPGSTRQRKPRIEVLRSSQGSTEIGSDAAGGSSPTGRPAQPSWIAPPRRPPAETYPAAKHTGRIRSRVILLLLLAAAVIGSSLLYTYIASRRDAAELTEERTRSSAETARRVERLRIARDLAQEREATAPSAANDSRDIAPGPSPEASSAPARAPTPAARQAAIDETAEEPPITETTAASDEGGDAETVRAFYSALGDGDGAAAAQLVVPEKRRSGPLSAGALSRYYSSFRRPLRVRSVTRDDANTARVRYDYVLADGRLCRGEAAVDVVQRDGRTLVSRIRTQGPC